MNKKKIMPVKTTRVANTDYEDIATLKRFIPERGGIRTRRMTRLSVRDQREIALTVKNAREMALPPCALTVR